MSQLSSPERSGDQGAHWRNLFRRFLLEDQVRDESVRDLAVAYLMQADRKEKAPELVEDPINPESCDFTLQYRQESIVDPLEILADTAEEIAMEMADLRIKNTSGFRILGIRR